jgi:hypothetical protein
MPTESYTTSVDVTQHRLIGLSLLFDERWLESLDFDMWCVQFDRDQAGMRGWALCQPRGASILSEHIWVAVAAQQSAIVLRFCIKPGASTHLHDTAQQAGIKGGGG